MELWSHFKYKLPIQLFENAMVYKSDIISGILGKSTNSPQPELLP